MPKTIPEEPYDKLGVVMFQIDEIRKMNKRLVQSNFALQQEIFYFKTSLPHRLAEGVNRIILRHPRIQRGVQFLLVFMGPLILGYAAKKILGRPTTNHKPSLAELFPSPPSAQVK